MNAVCKSRASKTLYITPRADFLAWIQQALFPRPFATREKAVMYRKPYDFFH